MINVIKTDPVIENIPVTTERMIAIFNREYLEIYTCSKTPISISLLMLELGPLIKFSIIGKNTTPKIWLLSPKALIPVIKMVEIITKDTGY